MRNLEFISLIFQKFRSSKSANKKQLNFVTKKNLKSIDLVQKKNDLLKFSLKFTQGKFDILKQKTIVTINQKLSTSRFVRRFRVLSNNILRYIQKIFITISLLCLVVFFALKLFKPSYLEKIYSYSSRHLYGYFSLDSYSFSAIEIIGNERTSRDEILNVIAKAKNNFNNINNYKDEKNLINLLANEIKSNLPWIHQVNIYRTLPNKLRINIIEYIPFAIWHDDGEEYAIDKDGNKVKINGEEFENLIILSGKNANLNVKSLFNILTIDPEFSSNIYSATFVGGRRWDIRFENGLLVKLPANNINEAWSHLVRIYNDQDLSNNLKNIDLRIDGKIYLKYKAELDTKL